MGIKRCLLSVNFGFFCSYLVKIPPFLYTYLLVSGWEIYNELVDNVADFPKCRENMHHSMRTYSKYIWFDGKKRIGQRNQVLFPKGHNVWDERWMAEQLALVVKFRNGGITAIWEEWGSFYRRVHRTFERSKQMVGRLWSWSVKVKGERGAG